MRLGPILIGMHYLIYKITNKLDNKIYVGKHKTEDKNDEYFGSGLLLKRAVKKHGKEYFVKEILIECKSEDEMNQKEMDIVDEIFISRDDTYNIKLGGCGGFDYINTNELNRTELAVSNHKKNNRPDIARKKLSELMEDGEFRKELNMKRTNILKLYHSTGFEGRTHTEETKKKMSDAKTGKVNGSKNPSYGKHWITDGFISKLVLKTDTLPTGFKAGRI
jgi:hypothetical protein